jgi:DNA-binding GntR family transcriptional regulator
MILPESSVAPASHSLTMVIRARIIAGEYPTGSWIREVELQREFGVSNGPVREALQHAVADGIAERVPFRGVRVIDLSEREIEELFEVRYALLGFAAELAAAKATPATAESAARIKSALEPARTEDAPGILIYGDFSHWVFELAGNACLAQAYERPHLQSRIYIGIARKHHDDRDALIPYVEAVIDAIVEGRASRARRAVRALTLQTLHHVREAARRNAKPVGGTILT